MVNLTIDGKQVQVKENTTILEAARAAGIHVPSLCYLKDINEIGACRVCVVEVEGVDKLISSCNKAWQSIPTAPESEKSERPMWN